MAGVRAEEGRLHRWLSVDMNQRLPSALSWQRGMGERLQRPEGVRQDAVGVPGVRLRLPMQHAEIRRRRGTAHRRRMEVVLELLQIEDDDTEPVVAGPSGQPRRDRVVPGASSA